jgi:hypothetical protein
MQLGWLASVVLAATWAAWSLPWYPVAAFVAA